MRWAGNSASISELRNLYTFSAAKLQGNRAPETHTGLNWDNIIIMGPKTICEYLDYINLPQHDPHNSVHGTG